ncbi:MAG: hypothetical protein JEZ07_15360 [Phycisphaerae bacterium]|nr:hypothetical protein [Phycisphaerae bacterium]
MKIIRTILVLVMVMATMAQGRIKLVALPERADSIVRLDNPQFTLIEEERVLTLQQGVNKVDFSWKGVNIDVDSIRLSVIDHPDEVKLLNVSYPPNEAALVWEISSNQAREETVRISYLLGGIDRLVTYKAVADKDETQVDLKSYIVLRNFSGEDFDNTQIVLDYGQTFMRDIRHEETKQLQFFKKTEVPITKIWTFDARSMVWDPETVPDQNIGIPVSYRIVNDKKSKLGDNALWDGKTRIYQNDGHDSTIFLGEDNAPMTPVGEKVELKLGNSRDIVVTQRKMDTKDINKIFTKESDYRNRRLVMFDREELITAKIENFKDKTATLTMIQQIPGEWEMLDCNMKYTRKDNNTIEFEVKLPARSADGPAKKELEMKYVIRHIRANQQPRVINR